MKACTLRFLLVVVSISCTLCLRRIGIIGSGPAGLSLAACLRQLKSGCDEVVVYESRSDPLQARLGGGVQLTGGAKILELIGLLPQIDSVAQPLRRVYSRNTDGKVLLDLNVAELVKARASVELCDAKDSNKPLVFSIMRDALQKILYDATQCPLPSDDIEGSDIPSVKIETNKKLVSIDENNKEEKGVSLTFEDGSTAEGHDVVFVANGVRSFPISSNTSDVQKYEALEDNYTGIRITYVVSDVDDSFSLRPNGANTFEQYFGDGCYALSGSYGGLNGVQHMLAVVYKDSQDATQGINESWQNDEDSMKVQIKQRLTRAGLSRYDSLMGLLDVCPNDRFFDLGVRDNTVNTLKTPWASSTGRTIFLGDSAHAMPPFLGQGANQALQDAYLLAEGVKKINQDALSENQQMYINKYQRETQKLQFLVLSYQLKRKLFTVQLGLKARILGVIETLGGFRQLFRDAFFQVMAKLGIVSYVFLDGAKPRI